MATYKFVIDQVKPIVSGVEEGGIYDSRRIISFNEGTATLNGIPFASNTELVASGNHKLVVEDLAGNVTTVDFEIKPYIVEKILEQIKTEPYKGQVLKEANKVFEENNER